MNKPSSATVIIAVSGGQETQEVSLESAQEAFARGEIEPTRWAWCRTHQNWKPISELPEFQFANIPAALIQPAVVTQMASTAQPRVSTAAATPAVKSKPIVQTVVRVKTSKELVVKEEPSFSFFKLFVILLGLAVASVLGVNYLLVDQPLKSNLLKTSFATTPVYAHLAAFCQPDAIIIHLRPSRNVNSSSLANYLISLAQSTPAQPINHQPFATVGLTSTWTSQFLMTGADWQTLGGMADATEDQKKDFILTHIGYPTGQRFVSVSDKLSPEAANDRRNQNWQALIAILVPYANPLQIPTTPPPDPGDG